MSDYSKYVFSLGDNPKRHYSGIRLRPTEGLKIAFKLVPEIFKLFSLTDGDNEALDEGIAEQSIKANLAEFDTEKYMGFTDYILSKTVVEARSDDGKSVNIINGKGLDDWFSFYPEDYMLFTGHVLWENTKIFFPQPVQKALQQAGEGLQAAMSPLT